MKHTQHEKNGGKKMEPKQLLTVQQLQDVLQISRQVIYNLRKEGMPYKQIGKAVRFDYDEVMKWIEGQNKK